MEALYYRETWGMLLTKFIYISLRALKKQVLLKENDGVSFAETARQLVGSNNTIYIKNS